MIIGSLSQRPFNRSVFFDGQVCLMRGLGMEILDLMD